MDIEKTYSKFDTFFNIFHIHKQLDVNLSKIDCYYVDEEKKKYVFACKVYSDKQSLFENWELDQDQDIALYLQNNLFARDDLRWDIYYLIIYTGNETLGLEEYHNIERDRFCCKKIIVNLSSGIQLEELLNLKLPITHNFYKLRKMENYITNEVFFNELREISGLDIKLFPDELLSEIGKKKYEFIDKLRVITDERRNNNKD